MKEKVVRTIIQEGPARIAELISLGMQFSERATPLADGARELDLGREGGHSKRRILHAKELRAGKLNVLFCPRWRPVRISKCSKTTWRLI